MIETGCIVGPGALSGASLGPRLACKLMTGDENGSGTVDFMTPRPLNLTVLGGVITVAMVMAWIPARRAGRTAPAEAPRYEEHGTIVPTRRADRRRTGSPVLH